MDLDSIKQAYHRYAPVYDTLFGPLLQPGRRRIVEALDCRPGERVLEVGVGTGLSLPLYPKDVKVTGIDVSPDMLRRARARVTRLGLTNVEAVAEMDALDMDFPTGRFDKAVLMYVVSVVPDVQGLMREVRRVTKRGGEIFIVNHFRSEAGAARKLETAFAPLARTLGFHTDIELQALLDGAGLKADAISAVNLFGYWKLARCYNAGP